MAKSIAVILNLKDKFSTPLKDIAKKLNTTEKELKKATNAVGKFQKQIGVGLKNAAMVTAASTAVIGVGLATAGMSFIKLASDAEETNNKISVVFGKSSQLLQKWSQTSIKTMGLAGQSALDSAALFGDMGRGMGISEQKAATMAMKLTQLSADLASFKNVQQDVAKTALNGIFSGETESLKQLGIVMTQANLEEFAYSKGIKKKIKDMKEAEKVQLRYNYVLEKTKLAQGDFERTGGGAANQLRMFQELKLEIGSKLGQIFLPTFTKQLKEVNRILTVNMPTIQKVATQAFNSIGNVIKFVGNNLNWIIPIASALLSTFIAFKTITTVITIFTTLKGVIQALSVTQGIWNALMLANPIGLVAVGIGVLVAAGVALYMNWSKVVNVLKQAWEWLVKVGQVAINFTPTGMAINAVKKATKKPPGHATGTSYFAGGPTRINEGGRSEMAVLPSGSQIIPHDISKKTAGKGGRVNINITVAGNVIGNQEFLNQMGNMFANKIQLALANS